MSLECSIYRLIPIYTTEIFEHLQIMLSLNPNETTLTDDVEFEQNLQIMLSLNPNETKMIDDVEFEP